MYPGYGHPHLAVDVVVTMHTIRIPEGKDWVVMEEVSAHTPILESSLGAAAVIADPKGPLQDYQPSSGSHLKERKLTMGTEDEAKWYATIWQQLVT